MQQKIDLRFSLLLTFVFLAALTRIMPHWPNVTAMGAMALFGAAHFRNRYLAFLVPLLALFVSISAYPSPEAKGLDIAKKIDSADTGSGLLYSINRGR